MKRLSFLAILIAGMVVNVAAQQLLKFQPEKPKPGEKITISYNPSGTTLMGLENPDAVLYLLEGALPVAKEVKLAKTGAGYTGEFTTNDTTHALFIVFEKDGKKDLNAADGYYTYLYSSEGKPVKGARKDVALVFNSYGGIWGMERNADKAMSLNKEELAAFPSIKKEKPLDVITLLYSSKDEADINEMKTALAVAASNPNATEAELMSAKGFYGNKFKDKEKADELDSLIKIKYPNGNWQLNKLVDSFYGTRDVAVKEKLYTDLEKASKTEDQKKRLQSYKYAIAYAYGAAGDLTKMNEIASAITDKSMVAGLYNSIAWNETGESVYSEPGKNLAKAKELSSKSLELLKASEGDISKKAPYQTEKQFKEGQKTTYNMYADTYALLLFHSKEYQKAYDIQKAAVEGNKAKDVSMNEAFAVYTEKLKGGKEAKTFLQKAMEEGNYSAKMKDQLKRLYLADKNTEAQWTAYLGKLESASIAKKKEELVKKMINETAPNFTLKDMDGKEVSLASLKGKTVVVDFWATWCGPCKASFPGMKMAVEKFREDKDVKFVFVDTWENGEKDEVLKNVADFIKKNDYPFHVLMDNDSKTVESFKVDGIPTKFVIDPNSNIRFKSVGFGGSADGLMNELALMIEMAKGVGTGTGSDKKAF